MYGAIEELSGRQVAVKKSRTSVSLTHSPARDLSPATFEMPSGCMDTVTLSISSTCLLSVGPSIAEQQKKNGAGVMLETVIQVANQTVRTTPYPNFIMYWIAPINSQDYSTSTRLASCIATSSLRTFFVHLTNHSLKSLTSVSPNHFLMVNLASTIH